MGPIIHFQCPGCEFEFETCPDGPLAYACPACGWTGRLRLSDSVKSGGPVDACAVCGHGNLYIQKDFNRALGLSIVGLGVGISIVLFALGKPLLAMLALVGMAGVDAVIYLMVSEVAVCYVCHAIYRGFEPNPAHEPFNLELLERYGGQPHRR